VIGGGRRFFAELERLELESMVAKELASPYRPGQRSEAWTKVKRSQECLCAVIGYVPDESDGFKSLVIAAEMDGELRCVGRVGGGISRALHERLWQLLRARPASSPLVDPRGVAGEWVAPGIYCRVSYLERTKDGNLRAPVFLGLVDDR
jgi:bifunctional non-homologous end joining protein LigD